MLEEEFLGTVLAVKIKGWVALITIILFELFLHEVIKVEAALRVVAERLRTEYLRVEGRHWLFLLTLVVHVGVTHQDLRVVNLIVIYRLDGKRYHRVKDILRRLICSVFRALLAQVLSRVMLRLPTTLPLFRLLWGNSIRIRLRSTS